MDKALRTERGDAEAEYQIAHHWLYGNPCDDDSQRPRMTELMRKAAEKNHPDAIWSLATRSHRGEDPNPELDQQILRAGELGSMNAQRELGIAYAWGDRPWPKDLAESARWYRLAAEQGHAESQYDLGFMLLLGEGGLQNIDEGLMWLERAGELGDRAACRLLTDCYQSGTFGVRADPGKAARWLARFQSLEANRAI